MALRIIARRSLLVTLGLCLLIARPADVGGDPPPGQREVGAGLPPLQPFDEPIVPLDPLRGRDEADNDRLRATALYASARLHDGAEEFSKALRYYQRCVRYDPNRVDALERIMDVSRHLGRHSEAARYAVLLVQQGSGDSLDLLRAFVYLTEDDKTELAIKLYEDAVGNRKPNNREPAWIELHKLAGQVYLRKEEFDKAATALGIVDEVLQHPDDYGLDDKTVKVLRGNAARLYSVIGEAHLKAKHFDKAEAAFEQVDKTAPSLGRGLFNAARVHLAADRKQEASESLQSYLDSKFSEQGGEPYDLLAELLPDDKDGAELIKRLEEAYENDKENASLGYYLAGRYLDKKRYDDAERIYKQHLKAAPQGRAYRGLAHIYHKTDQPAELLKTAAEVADKTSSLDILRDRLDEITGDAGFLKKVTTAADQRLGDQDKKMNFGESLAAALLLASAEQFDDAARFYEAAASTNKEQLGAVLESWGMKLLMADKYEQAAKVFRRAVDEKAAPDDNPIFHYYLSGALTMSDQHDEALAAARRAVEVSKDSPEFLSRVAWVLYRAQRMDEARKTYRQLIDRFDSKYDSGRSVLREARLTLSHLEAESGNMPEAVELLEQVLDEFPHDIGAANDLGYLWADQGEHLNRALQMIRAACAAQPDNAAYRDSLGWVLFRLGRVDQAIAELERATQGDDPDGVILDHLGDVYEKAGNLEKAITSWQRALQSFEKNKDQKHLEKTRAKLAKHQK